MQVHADLGLPFHQEAFGLHKTQSAADEADVAGDLVGDFHIVAVEVDVVGDEKRPYPNHRCPPGFRFGWAKIRLPGGVRGDFFFPQFIFTFANAGQFFAFWPCGGIAIQINGDAQFVTHPLSQPVDQGYTVG